MRSAGLVTHPDKLEAKTTAEEFRTLASERGISCVDDPEGDYQFLAAIGGDGTILRAARLAHRRQVPLFGINVGRLGFLSSVQATGLPRALDSIAAGRYILEPRMMLTAEGAGDFLALNEMVVERAKPSRVIRLRLSVDSEAVATYAADGFIVATPTGSTAYSLSAGGPVLEPSLEALILTPVSAHSPLWRSIVLESHRVVGLEVVEGSAALTADGDPMATLEVGGEVRIRRHRDPLNLMHPIIADDVSENLTSERLRYFEKLRSRFNLDLDR